MEGIPIDIASLLKAALVFLRISALLFALPFFGEQVVALPIRLFTSLALALGLFSLLPTAWAPATVANMGAAEIAVMMVRELLIGLIIGYVGKMIFESLVMSANLVGYQMGFGTANLLLPGSENDSNAFAGLHLIIVLLVFLSLGLHYIFIHALVLSFKAIPAGAALLQPLLGEHLIALTASIFVTALQLAAPILVALLFTMAGLGLIARTVPQLNVFTLSFPVSFFVGLSVYVAMTPFFPEWLSTYYRRSAENLLTALQGMIP